MTTRRRSTRFVLFGAATLALVAALLWPFGQPNGRTDASPRPVATRGALTPDEVANIDVFKRISPSVVHITTLASRREMFSTNVQQVPRGTGTGFVWDDNGHIVTNFHVIQGGNAARVTLNDQTSYPAQLVGVFADRDLAVLRIEAKGKLPPIPIGTSRDLIVGQRVYAIGNPFGLDQTLTTGIVSALNREIESTNERIIRGVIQTDAAINPGNSGGPLLDGNGRVIGVNSQIKSGSGSNSGVGFAVPVATIQFVVPQIQSGGKVVRAYLGVSNGDTQDLSGAVIGGVVPNGPAQKAGLQQGDKITDIDGRAVKSSEDVSAAVAARKPGEKARITVVRGGDRRTLTVDLGTRPDTPAGG